MVEPVRGHDKTPRRKVEVDLQRVEERNLVGAEQVAYYSARAPWFDDTYTSTGDYDAGHERNRAWQAEMSRIEQAMTNAGLHGSCVELGAGTGYWSERIANLDAVTRVTALDASPEMLALTDERLSRADATFDCQQVDLWHWDPVEVWDSAAAFFFIEHVPDSVLPALLTTLHRALRPGAPLFVAEAAWDAHEPSVETRSIAGQTYRVVERRRSRAEFEAAFAGAGFSVSFGPENYLIDLVATRT